MYSLFTLPPRLFVGHVLLYLCRSSFWLSSPSRKRQASKEELRILVRHNYNYSDE